MRAFLLWSFTFLSIWIATVVIALVLLRWRLHKANRVSPSVRSPAPASWLWAPSQPARLHRRLRTASRSVLLPPAPPGGSAGYLSVETIHADLQHSAAVVDHHVVVASRQPRDQRRRALADLEAQVAQLESLSVRVSSLSRPAGIPASGWESTGSSEALADLERQLSMLEDARSELAGIEREAGLVDLGAHLPPPPGPPAGLPRTTQR